MQNPIRIILIIGGLLMLILAAGYAFRWSWAISTWLWSDSPLSYTFIASMQAAIAAAMLWIGISGEFSALAAGALNLIVMMGGLAISFAFMSRQSAYGFLGNYALVCGVFAVINIPLFVWSRRIPLRATHPTPWPVRLSYVIFIIFLLAVGLALILRAPNIMPWPMTAITQATAKDDSVVFGWMFLGDAFYFVYALLYPQWRLASAQLWSFLAYDLVLLGPFLKLLYAGPVKPQFRNSLLIYTAILIYSGLLALYYLLVNPPGRSATKRRVNYYELRS